MQDKIILIYLFGCFCFIVSKRKPTVVVGGLEFVMSENIAVIPKGTKIQIMGCSYTLLEDIKVNGTQGDLDNILKAQDDFDNGVGVCSVGSG